MLFAALAIIGASDWCAVLVRVGASIACAGEAATYLASERSGMVGTADVANRDKAELLCMAKCLLTI